MRAWLPLWAILLVTSGCGAEGSYSLRILFPDQEARDETARIGAWVLRPGGFDCMHLESGEARIAEMDIESSLVLALQEDPAGTILEQVPAGDFLFFVEAQTSSGARILRGCTKAKVKTGVNMEITVALTWVCRPFPQGEVPQNGIDDDCDGETDES